METFMTRNWTALIDRIVALFPATDPEVLREIGGRMEALIDYLARAHDLTAAEAREMIELRVGRAAARQDALLAAE